MRADRAAATTLDRATLAPLVALAAVAAAAWAGLAGYEPPMGAAGFLAGWTLMMAAMMLPSISPPMLPYRGSRGRLGFLGCCVGLMAVLVLAASMSLVSAAAIAAVVFVQKVLPLGELSARLTGILLLAAAAVLAVS